MSKWSESGLSFCKVCKCPNLSLNSVVTIISYMYRYLDFQSIQIHIWYWKPPASSPVNILRTCQFTLILCYTCLGLSSLVFSRIIVWQFICSQNMEHKSKVQPILLQYIYNYQINLRKKQSFKGCNVLELEQLPLWVKLVFSRKSSIIKFLFFDPFLFE